MLRKNHKGLVLYHDTVKPHHGTVRPLTSLMLRVRRPVVPE